MPRRDAAYFSARMQEAAWEFCVAESRIREARKKFGWTREGYIDRRKAKRKMMDAFDRFVDLEGLVDTTTEPAAPPASESEGE